MFTEVGFPTSPELPEELRLLRMLHNVGATASEKSLSLQEICQWTEMESATAQRHLQKLTEVGYVEYLKANDIDKYHVTLEGMRKVLSMYS